MRPHQLVTAAATAAANEERVRERERETRLVKPLIPAVTQQATAAVAGKSIEDEFEEWVVACVTGSCTVLYMRVSE